MPVKIKGNPNDPQAKPKNFEEELRHTLKERKRRGLTVGMSDTAEESDSADSLNTGADGDDFLTQFTSRSKGSSTLTGSSKQWAPPQASPRQQTSNKTSPSPSPRSLPSPRGLPSPTPHTRTRFIDKGEEPPRKRLSSSPNRQQDEQRNFPHPKPRSRRNTDDSIDSPGRDAILPEPRGSPRLKSEHLDRKSGLAPLKMTPRKKSSEDDELLGMKSGRNVREGSPSPEPKRRTKSPSILDDLLEEDTKTKMRRKSPESKTLNRTLEPKQRARIHKADGDGSPVGSRKMSDAKSPDLKTRKGSVLDNLLGNGGELKSRSESPEPKGRSRSPSILDDLLNGGSSKKARDKKKNTEPDSVLDDLLGLSKKPKSRSASPELKLKPKSRDGSPEQTDKSRRKKGILDSNGSEEDEPSGKTNRSRKSISPTRESQKGGRRSLVQKGVLDSSDEDDDQKEMRARLGKKSRSQSPNEFRDRGDKKSPNRRGLLDSSDNDADTKMTPKRRSRSPTPKGSKTTVPHPRPSSIKVEPKASDAQPKPQKQSFKVDDFLDSGSSDSEDERNVSNAARKTSLLDVFEDKQRPKSNKKKKSAKSVLEDSEDEDTDTDTDNNLGKTKPKRKPPVISGRRPKEGYQSAGEDEIGQQNTVTTIAKPIPRRPTSSLVPGGGAATPGNHSPLNPSLNSSMNAEDSASIRQAIYGEWRAKKQQVAEKQAREKRRNEKEEKKKKEQEILEKRAVSTASFNAWKETKNETLKHKAKEEAEKKKKEKEKEEQKMMQTIHSMKAFEAWKGDKDEKLKETHKKKVHSERQKMETKEEQKIRTAREARSAFQSWKNVKDDCIIKQNKDKEKAAEEKQRREEEAKMAKEEGSWEAYEKWEKKIGERKAKEKKQLANSQPISTMPFRPCSNTVPFRR